LYQDDVTTVHSLDPDLIDAVVDDALALFGEGAVTVS